jgi:periplasmic protein TonB
MAAVMGKSPQSNIFWPVCFSLAIHIALGAAVIAGLSGHWNFSASTSKLNLVWVSLETKNPGNVSAVQQRSENKLPVVEKIVTQAANPIHYEKKEESIKTSAAAEQIGSAQEIKYISAGGDTAKNNSSNHTGGTALMAATDQLSFGLANAYPRYRENKPPVYPEIAKTRGYEGIVFVTAEILTDGNVGSLNIGKSSGYAVLDAAAIEAVKHWKFEPARKMGKPCPSRVNLPIRFDIRDNDSQS